MFTIVWLTYFFNRTPLLIKKKRVSQFETWDGILLVNLIMFLLHLTYISLFNHNFFVSFIVIILYYWSMFRYYLFWIWSFSLVNNYHHLSGSDLLENVSSYVKVIWFVICLCFWYQVINDLLDPTGQNLRVREDAQVSFVLS